MLKPALAALLGLSCAATPAQEMWRASAGAVFGQTWLGSQDLRSGGIYTVSYARPEPRLHFWGYDAEMDFEAYYMFSQGGGDFLAGHNSSHHYGLMAVGRYYQKYTKSTRAFVEAGWGLQFTNRLTHDLDSRINSTPMLGVGIVVPFEDFEVMFNVRYFHISNAGTAGGNEGLNFFQVQTGLRF
jgi:hypothetical protein